MGRKLTFLWDEFNSAHIALHNVTVDEFEEAFTQPMVETVLERGGEKRIVAFAKTGSGRYLFLAYAVRNGRVRPVTAYTLPRRKRNEYEEAIKNL